MITNFEEITKDLSEEEKKLLPILIKGFRLHGIDDPIKAPDIIQKLSEKGIKLTGARLRKLTNLIRSAGILPLIATSNGYYVTVDKQEVQKQIKSLTERAEAIMAAAKGLEKWL